MSTTLVVVNEIERETEKAILVRADGSVWLPKSQIVKVFDGENLPAIAIEIPTWLWIKNRSVLRIRTSVENIAKYL